MASSKIVSIDISNQGLGRGLIWNLLQTLLSVAPTPQKHGVYVSGRNGKVAILELLQEFNHNNHHNNNNGEKP
eukprot:scaffold3209_cov152-Amphora_coffeaeformis.AAC.2